MRRLLGIAFLFGLLSAGALPAQNGASPELEQGQLLIASRDLRDPNFAQTVILILRYDDDGAVGVILNRRTGIAVASALPDMKAAHDVADPAFSGGPVDKDGAFALIRSNKKPEESQTVLRGVYLLTDESFLEKVLLPAPNASTFRLYLGYTGWSAGQLDHEVDLGAWNILNGSPDLVFDSGPGTLWTRLIRLSELRIARRKTPVRLARTVVPMSR